MHDRNNKLDEEKQHPYAGAFGQAAQVGVTLFANIFVGFLLGRFLDKILGTSPLLILVFMVLGVVSGFWSIYKQISHIGR